MRISNGLMVGAAVALAVLVSHRRNRRSIVSLRENISVAPLLEPITDEEAESNKESNAMERMRAKGDGCGVANDVTTPLWVPSTAEELDRLERIQQCASRMKSQRKVQVTKQYVNRTMTSLHCELRVSTNDLSRIVRQHSRIWFIGDSVMRDQYLVFLCMLDSDMKKGQGLMDLNANHLITSYPFVPTFNDSALGKATIETHAAMAHNTTIIRYSRFGRLWQRSEDALFKTAFPKAIESSTSKEAIVLDAGLHYDFPFASNLEKAAIFIANASQHSAAPIYFMETTDEQWPTSNGMFTKACMWKCQCEALTPGRIEGRGVPHDQGSVNISNDFRTASQIPSRVFFGKIYPELFYNSSSFYSTYNSSVEECIPYCLPPSWRNDLVNPILLNRTSSRVDVVPVWRQLVSHGIPHMRSNGDCTHKSADAYQMMNEQLARSMMTRLR